jgi:hypothetical protein
MLRFAAMLLAAAAALSATEQTAVHLIRVPQGGLQPQVAVGGDGVVHLIYFLGDPGAGDIYYIRKSPDEHEFSKPLRVNSQPGSAIAIGTIRGAQIAIGRNGRVHVAWNGSRQAEPKGPGGGFPMLYTRMNDAGSGFEPQRNVMQVAAGLDGGGSVAADGSGNVYVAWHAPDLNTQGEENRRVWIARSRDDGKTFGREQPAWQEPTGACGCCGMRAFADSRGNVSILYRAATHGDDRDMVLLVSRDHGDHFRGVRVHKWKLNACPMTSDFLAETPDGIAAAWQTENQVYFAKADPKTLQISTPVAPPGEGIRKHPVIAVNSQGETILAWTEGTGWKKGGSVAWQVFDRAGRPEAESGSAAGLPPWSLAAVFTGPGGSFTIIY